MSIRLVSTFCTALTFGLLLPVAALAAEVIDVPDLALGDRWAYRIVDGLRKNEIGRIDVVVIAATSAGTTLEVSGQDGSGPFKRTEKLGNKGEVLSGALDGETSRTFTPPLVRLDFPLRQGHTWSQWVDAVPRNSTQSPRAQMWGRVGGAEQVETPAGLFDAVKVRRIVQLDDEEFWRTRTRRTDYVWYAPQVKAVVREERRGEYLEKGGLDAATITNEWIVIELVSFLRGR